jgi:hypothetical protein
MWPKLHRRYSEIDAKLDAWFIKNKNILIILGVTLYARIVFATLPKDLWHDEAFQYLYSLKPISFIIAGNDVHPPLYNIFTHYLIRIVGPDLFMLRWVGATIFSVLFVVGLYYLVRGLFDEKVAFWSTMFIALAPTYIYYSLEFRNYAFTLFFLVIQIYYFNKMLEFPAVDKLAGYILFSLIILYSHYLTSLILFAQLIYITILWLWKKVDTYDLRYYAVTYGILAVLCIPLLIYSLMMASQVQSFWFKNIGLTSLISTFAYLVSPPLIVPTGIATIIFGIAGYSVWKFRKEMTFHHLQFALYLFVPILTMFIISQAIPFYHHRYFLFGGIGLFVFAGWGLTKLGEMIEEFDYCLFGLYVLLLLGSTSHGFADAFQHDISDSVVFLANYTSNITGCDQDCVIIHSSQFSQTPYKVYFPSTKNYLITNFTRAQRFTAGGSVIEDWEVYKNISDVPRTRYMFWISNKELEGQKTIYAEGGLYIQEIE